MITVAEVRRLALKHYNEGGDGVVESYTDSDIQLMIDNNYKEAKDWIKLFQFYHSCEIWE